MPMNVCTDAVVFGISVYVREMLMGWVGVGGGMRPG